jgi:hypothetical protein
LCYLAGQKFKESLEMKKLLVNLFLLACFSVPLHADCFFNNQGYVTTPTYVAYKISIICGSTCGLHSYTLGAFSYSEGDWNQDFFDDDPNYPYWHCSAGAAGCGCSFWNGNLNGLPYDNEVLRNEAYLAKELIDANEILDYLNEEFPDGGGDPNFEEEFLSAVEMDDTNVPPSEAAFEKNTGTSERADPVFLNNGEYRLAVTDLSVAGRGLPVEIVRTYGSRRDYNSRFGFGWDMNYNMRLQARVCAG